MSTEKDKLMIAPSIGKKYSQGIKVKLEKESIPS